MSNIEQVQELRKRTGASMLGCKICLEEAGGDIEKAIELLRKKGLKDADKKGGRVAGEGWIGSYVHSNGKVASLVAVACETDFVARTDEFKELTRNLAMQVAASEPKYVKPEDLPESVIQKEKEIYREQLKNEGKPEDIMEKILQGKVEKFYTEVCLIKQPYIKDDKISIEGLVKQAIAKLGENIEIKSISRITL